MNRTTTRSAAVAAGVATAALVLAASAPSGAADELVAFDVSADVPFVRNVVVGPDGSAWIRGEDTSLARIDPESGALDPICPLDDYDDVDSNYELEVDPDGRVWVPWTPDVNDADGTRIIRVDPTDCGAFDVALGTDNGAAAVAALDDGTVWVSTFNVLVQLDGDAMTVLDLVEGSFPYFDTMVVVGDRAIGARSSDGTLWAVDLAADSATELSPVGFDHIAEIVLGPDGRAWFAGSGPEGMWVGSVALDGTGLVSTGLFELGNASGAAFGPDGNLWIGNDTPDRLLVVDPATSAVLRELDLAEPGFDPGPVAATAGEVLVAAPRQSTVLRIRVQAPPGTTTTTTTSTTTPTPAEPPAAAPVGAQPTFTG
jgi:streptogramin lyase